MEWLKENWFKLVATGILLGAMNTHSHAYFKVVQWVVCGAAAYSAYLYFRSGNSGAAWIFVFFAWLFHPIGPAHLEIDGDWLADDLLAAELFIVSMVVAVPRFWKHLQAVAWLYIMAAFGIIFYANQFYPHGPSVPTGEIVCENDDSGPCGEQTIEDTRKLDVPEWVKLARDNESAVTLSMLGIFLVAVYLRVSLKDPERSC